MNNIELLSKIYKPYKVTVKGNVKIFNCLCGNYVVKGKCDKDIRELYKYLSSRGFNYYPKLIEDNRSNINIFEYIEDNSLDNEQKLMDLINVLSLLHNKTSYFKEITNDKIKSIYEELLGRVLFIEESLNNIITEFESSLFISPSANIILNNSTKIFESLTFLKKEIEEWYKLSLDQNKIRVALIHNNVTLEHFIKNENDYLISWEKYKIDSPILDIVKLYKDVYLNMNFTESLKTYLEKFPLLENEKKLLFIMLILPDELIIKDNELLNVSIVRKYVDYVFKTEELVKNFY